MLIATYNICHGHYTGLDMQALGRAIRQLAPDVIGLQEVDVGTRRAGRRNLLRELAAAAEMPYFSFCPAITFEGGEYGTAVMSRYPIRCFTVHPYSENDAEPRTYSRMEMLVAGQRFAFFNTHCAVADPDVRPAQLAELALAVSREKAWILTGDFNENDLSAFSVFPSCRMVNAPASRYGTFYPSDAAIDNILCAAPPFRIRYSGMEENTLSDHYMLWADIAP